MIKSLWNEEEAGRFTGDDLALRVYTSRLLGQDESLVLHGGGNTSVKIKEKNLFGEEEEILYVKGSGWDLGSIEKGGFAPVKMDVLLKMAQLESLSDTDMVLGQKSAMKNPNAPTPSVEAILHAIIPFKFVDHTHTDAVVTITNTPNGEELIKEIYGDELLIIPYVMPGFILAKKVYDLTVGMNWSSYRGMVLLNHGLFTFSDVAQEAYENMIELVQKGEEYLEKRGATPNLIEKKNDIDLLELARIRKEVGVSKGAPVIAYFEDTPLCTTVANMENLNPFLKAPLTPDHVIRTKAKPAVLDKDFKGDIADFVNEYTNYFKRHNKGEVMINPTPNFAIWKKRGAISFGGNFKEAKIISDIKEHTFFAILRAEELGGWSALEEGDIFMMEYWELEQAKLKLGGAKNEFSGKVALFSGESKEIPQIFTKAGYAVFAPKNRDELHEGIKKYGGIDLFIGCNGDSGLLEESLPFLKLGFEPCIISIEGNTITKTSIDGDKKLTLNVEESESIGSLVLVMSSKLFSKINN